MPPHTLLIQSKNEIQEKGFAEYEKREEYPRGAKLTINILITNIGSEPFPGGKIERVSLQYFPSGLEAWQTPGVEIPTLLARQAFQFTSGTFDLFQEGIVILKCNVSARDIAPISYYQVEGGDPMMQWTSRAITVLSREAIHTVRLLEEINNKIGSLRR
jgi:hypothetical protein